jgi:hypothetical protein
VFKLCESVFSTPYSSNEGPQQCFPILSHKAQLTEILSLGTCLLKPLPTSANTYMFPTSSFVLLSGILPRASSAIHRPRDQACSNPMMAGFSQHIEKSNVMAKSTTEAGNGLFATRQIKLNNTVLSVGQPLMLALDTPRLNDTCYCCHLFMEKSAQMKRDGKIKAKTLKACTGCTVVRYCDKVRLNHAFG